MVIFAQPPTPPPPPHVVILARLPKPRAPPPKQTPRHPSPSPPPLFGALTGSSEPNPLPLKPQEPPFLGPPPLFYRHPHPKAPSQAPTTPPQPGTSRQPPTPTSWPTPNPPIARSVQQERSQTKVFMILKERAAFVWFGGSAVVPGGVNWELGKKNPGGRIFSKFPDQGCVVGPSPLLG